MDLIAAEKLSLDLMTKHGLIADGWAFKFDRGTNRVGACSYRTKTISISKAMVLMSPAYDITQTMLHEIAHALITPKRNNTTPKQGKKASWVLHGPEWLAKAQSIGYVGNRTTDPESVYSIHLQNIAIQKSIDKHVAARANRTPLKRPVRRVSAVTPNTPELVRGDKVKTLGSHRRLSGKYGVIVHVGKKRYRVELADNTHIYAPFNMVTKVVS